ncbi:MAG: DNA-binding protein HU [Alphaproteobacteria bacterium RIFCSPLOWO2_01_FULL_45_8]|nr:MAG: DNA-binding protein HU [Alphaproteobacteria bacterium GWA1_45_9]OFW90060.1 MAG: DNA-binding protein HU [Alphaproteobacteria bacterium RIFCSPHIGHO2_01_FULL_41_14]OFW96280.1 MAG: DNA-binding protein HU [Alphaproteobacteria bacterium RIFCSPLOWO2_01_FULL_45_8]HCI48563.1 DNA-binding protein HU [Holosporales bacterium]
MKKNELIVQVAENAGLSKASAAKAVDGVFESIAKALKAGEAVRVVGFGTFLTVHRKATEGRNPRTGEKIKIAAARLPKFKAGKGLKERVAK